MTVIEKMFGFWYAFFKTDILLVKYQKIVYHIPLLIINYKSLLILSWQH